MSRFYTLDADHKLVPTDDVLVWGAWFEKHRVQKVTAMPEAIVSTLFVGLGDSERGSRGRFFETALIRDDKIVEEIESSSWAEAMDAHKALERKAESWSI